MAGLADSVAAFTGGGSGIGRGAARVFARYGAKVALIDRNLEAAEAAAAGLRAEGREARAYPADVASEVEVERALDAVERDLGPLDHAFNAAGVRGVAKPVVEMSVEEFAEVIDVNLLGVFICLRAELRRMGARGHGRIVNCTSVAGLTGGGLGAAQYAASKHGVVGLTRTAALEAIRQGVRINAIAPGFTETNMVSGGSPERLERLRAMYAEAVPIARSAQPEEIGEAVAWMCSDHAGYLVGHVMLLDGGMIAGLHNIMRRPD